ncbi:MAG: tetratricopeptide repeat protein [Candidatus Anammoximicrobium sp.]|nr:tetratricopeptide repeat protein [Candidatus Anammoximicrobium sp.]
MNDEQQCHSCLTPVFAAARSRIRLSGLLELGRYDDAASACEQYALRYPDSELLDSFWYITGYGRFVAGQPDAARELLRKVAAHRPIDKTTGQPADSPNKWPAIYILGQIEHSLGRVAEAIQQYRLVKDRFPDARQSIAALLRKTIGLPKLTTIRPGKPAEVLLDYRNLTACEVKVYRIDLAKFALVRRGLGEIAQVNLAGIQPLHEATVKLADGRDYRTGAFPRRRQRVLVERGCATSDQPDLRGLAKTYRCLEATAASRAAHLCGTDTSECSFAARRCSPYGCPGARR